MAKLLIVTTVSTTLEAFLLPFACHFRALGWRVDAASSGVEGSELCGQNFNHCYEMRWSRNPHGIKKLADTIRDIRKLMAENDYDIVHVHTPIAAFITRFALRKARSSGKVKIVYTAHGFHFYQGDSFREKFIFKTAEKIAVDWTDHLIVINDEDYRAALGLLPHQKVTLMSGGIGVELEKYRYTGFSAAELTAARAELGAAAGDTVILMIAEFAPRKRHRDLVKALALAGDPTLRLAFAGIGPMMEQTRKFAESSGVIDNIKFLGFRRDIPLLIAAADATALPSDREGLPRSIMESMIVGTPVIGADVRGIKDLIGDGAGTLVTLGDINGLAAALKKHQSQGPEIIAIKKKARERTGIFDVRNILKQHEEIYENLLNERKSRNRREN